MTTEAEALVLADAAYTAVTGLSATSIELSAIVQVAYAETTYGDVWAERGLPNTNNIGNLIANADFIAANPNSYIDWPRGLRIYTDGLTGLYTAKFRSYASAALGWQDFVRALLVWQEWPNVRASTKACQIRPKAGTPNFTDEQLYLTYFSP